MERGLDAAHRGANELRDVLERVIKDVFQQHAGALHWRKRQHEMLECPAESGARWIDRHDGVRRRGTGLRLLPNPAASQEIDTAIVGNPEQPRCQGTRVVEGVQLAIGLKQGVLNDVLAIQHGARHA